MRSLIALAALAALAACNPAATTTETTTVAEVSADAPYIVAALADTRRPAEDVARDAARHPADMLAFARIEPGDKVGEILPGGGYFTRIFAVALGDTGKLYPVIRPEATAGQYETPILPVAALYPNVQMARAEYGAVTFPEPLDVVFTAQNYHDFKIAEYNLGDIAAVNRAAFAALKPGGLYIVIDHAAPDGQELAAALANHRIDQALVRQEVEAAGFVFDGESTVLRNSADTRTTNVFDEAIRGHTDQFVMRFKKPE